MLAIGRGFKAFPSLSGTSKAHDRFPDPVFNHSLFFTTATATDANIQVYYKNEDFFSIIAKSLWNTTYFSQFLYLGLSL